MTKLFNRIGFSQLMMLVMAVLVTITPDFASAATTGLGNALCGALTLIQGDVAKGIATLAVVIVGFAALMGRVQWGMAIIVGLGIGVIFGAGAIVSALGGSGGTGSVC